MLDVKWDAGGVVREPDVHDANFTGILVSMPNAMFHFIMEDGRRVELELVGLKGLVLDTFFEGNIVFEIEIKAVADAADAELAQVERTTEIDSKAIARFNKLRGSQLLLVTIDPTYGAKCTALCRGARYQFVE